MNCGRGRYVSTLAGESVREKFKVRILKVTLSRVFMSVSDLSESIIRVTDPFHEGALLDVGSYARQKSTSAAIVCW